MNHRRKQRRLTGVCAAVALTAGGAYLVVPSAFAGTTTGFNASAVPNASIGTTPGTYTYYSFPGGTGSLHDVSWTTTPSFDPGYTANVFWSHQFSFNDDGVAYIGMQSNGGSARQMLFSVWNATESKAGPGSTCSEFGGEGVGQHCSASVDWKAGHTYEFKVAPTDQQGWYDGSVTDTTTRTVTDLGSIRTPATGISPGGMIDWTEYFEWNSTLSNCYNQPSSAVTFGKPRANGGTATAAVSGSHVNDGCDFAAKVDTTAQGSVQSLATTNSTRGLVQNGQKCLTSTGGGTAGLSDCTVGTDRAWVYAADRTLRLKSDTCLTAGGAGAVTTACDGAPRLGQVTDPAKLWTYDPVTRTLRNGQSGTCLTAAAGSPTAQPCGTGTDQQWTLPSTDTATTPPPGTPPTTPPTTPPVTTPPVTPPGHTGELSDQQWLSAAGGWGPVEKNTSNGEQAAGDGKPLSLRGTRYAKGLGTHAASTIAYGLGGRCTSLSVDVGVDDEVGGRGSVDFQIYRDSTKVADSGTLTGKSAIKHLTANLTGGGTLRLVVNKAASTVDYDHADWADPQLTCN